jgi:hypothetical protein
MDPDAALDELLALTEPELNQPETHDRSAVDADQSRRIAELVHALDSWLIVGGFLPLRWRRPVP